MGGSFSVRNRARKTARQLGQNVLLFVAVTVSSAAVTTLIARSKVVSPSPASPPFRMEGAAATIEHAPHRPRLSVPDVETQTQTPASLDVPDELSPFQKAALATPAAVAHLTNELASSLGRMYEQVALCHRSADRSNLVFHFLVRSKGPVAEVVSARFNRIKSGTPLPQEVIDCVEQSLNKPFTLLADRGRPFPKDVEGEWPWEFVLGAP
jgi:hypothetical protein